MLIFIFRGVLTANELIWKQYIAYASGKIAREIGMIIKARHYLNKQIIFGIPLAKIKSRVTHYTSK